MALGRQKASKSSKQSARAREKRKQDPPKCCPSPPILHTLTHEHRCIRFGCFWAETMMAIPGGPGCFIFSPGPSIFPEGTRGFLRQFRLLLPGATERGAHEASARSTRGCAGNHKTDRCFKQPLAFWFPVKYIFFQPGVACFETSPQNVMVCLIWHIQMCAALDKQGGCLSALLVSQITGGFFTTTVLPVFFPPGGRTWPMLCQR